MFARVSCTRAAYSVGSPASRTSVCQTLDRSTLLDERDRARAQDLLTLLECRLGGETDDRSAGRSADGARRRGAVETREPVVHDHDVGGVPRRGVGRLGAASDGPDDLEARLQCEQELERRAVDLVVLDEQHAYGHARRSLRREEERVERLPAVQDVHLETSAGEAGLDSSASGAPSPRSTCTYDRPSAAKRSRIASSTGQRSVSAATARPSTRPR